MSMSTGNGYQLPTIAAFLLSHLEGNSSQGIWEACTIYFSVYYTFASCVLLIKEEITRNGPKMFQNEVVLIFLSLN